MRDIDFSNILLHEKLYKATLQRVQNHCMLDLIK